MTESKENEPTPLEQQIIDQFAFYFGDINYGRDKFMLQTAKDNDTWIPLSVMMTFNRLKSLSSDMEVILKALHKWDTELIEIEDNGDGKARIRRTKPIISDDLSFWKEVRERSVYVKGFPLNWKIDEIEKFMKKFGNVVSIVMRRVKSPEKLFKGSIFATFPTKKEAEDFVARTDVRIDGAADPLITKLQNAYHAQKMEKMKAVRDQVKAEKSAKPGKQVKPKKEFVYEHGLVVRLSGLTKDTDYHAIKKALGETNVAYVEKPSDDGVCFVRLQSQTKKAAGSTPVKKEENCYDVKAEGDDVKAEAEGEDVKPEAEGEDVKPEEPAPSQDKPSIFDTVIKSALNDDGKLIIGEAEIAYEQLSGDAEKAYYDRLQTARDNADKRGKQSFNRGGYGGGGRGGKFARGQKRKAADSAQQGGKVPKSEGKHTKFEDG